jgi:cytochrome c
MQRQFLIVAIIVIGAAGPSIGGATAVGDPNHGAEIFQACSPCHSLQPDRNLTGPSLAGVWSRKAGALESFERYSPALKSAGVVWSAQTLDAWLSNPAQFIPKNRMTFRGIQNPQARTDLIAFLELATSPGHGAPPQIVEKGGGMGRASEIPDLKKLGLTEQVRTIRYCHDTYHVTTADGETADFWERNIRFKTDSSDLGPTKGAPAILEAGMMGDRASVIFAMPEEISTFISHEC